LLQGLYFVMILCVTQRHVHCNLHVLQWWHSKYFYMDWDCQKKTPMLVKQSSIRLLLINHSAFPHFPCYFPRLLPNLLSP
jgi:hypothetical protein